MTLKKDVLRSTWIAIGLSFLVSFGVASWSGGRLAERLIEVDKRLGENSRLDEKHLDQCTADYKALLKEIHSVSASMAQLDVRMARMEVLLKMEVEAKNTFVRKEPKDEKPDRTP